MPSLISLPVNLCSVIMASRRSSDRTLDSNNQIVKIESASPINTVNRFTTLGTILKPNYSSVLASTYDLYALTNSHRPVQTIFLGTPIFPNMLKNVMLKTCFLLSQIGHPLLTLLDLLSVIFLHCFTGSLSTDKRMCNTILQYYNMRIQLPSSP